MVVYVRFWHMRMYIGIVVGCLLVWLGLRRYVLARGVEVQLWG